MHIATNVLREVTRNLGAKTKKGFRSRWRIAVSTIAAHHVHAHAHAGVISGPNRSALQVPKDLLSGSQQVCSRGPNRCALQVPTGLLFQVPTSLITRSQKVPTSLVSRSQKVSSPVPTPSCNCPQSPPTAALRVALLRPFWCCSPPAASSCSHSPAPTP